MNRVVLQVPMDPALRKAAEESAIDQGFSSLQDVVRLFLKRFADNTISVNFEQTVQLSPKAIKRYDKMTDDILSGEVKPIQVDSVDELMKHLNSES